MSDQSKFWIGTNWKMQKTLAQAQQFAEVLAAAETPAEIQCFVIPPFTVARQVKEILKNHDVLVGAQNMHWCTDVENTGEISAPMLNDCNLDLIEIGHSERRAKFGETDEAVGLKVKTAIEHQLLPLICVGETLVEREAGQTQSVLQRQVLGALAHVDKTTSSTILFAYEPVWAIGVNGMPASSSYADARHKEIIDMAAGVLGRTVPCLYGGSVNTENCEELTACAHIDGLFVGRSAWDVHGYMNIMALSSAVIKEKRK